MPDTPISYYGTEMCARFKQMDADIFKVCAQAKALGFNGVAATLYAARIELGHEETYARGEYARAEEAKEDAASSTADGVRPVDGSQP